MPYVAYAWRWLFSSSLDKQNCFRCARLEDIYIGGQHYGTVNKAPIYVYLEDRFEILGSQPISYSEIPGFRGSNPGISGLVFFYFTVIKPVIYNRKNYIKLSVISSYA